MSGTPPRSLSDLDQPLILLEGDMRRPSCGLCSRLGAQCTFPLRQKPPRGRRQTTNSENQNVLRSPISEILGTRERYAPHDAGAQSDIHIASLVPAPGSGTWIGGSQDTFSGKYTILWSHG